MRASRSSRFLLVAILVSALMPGAFGGSLTGTVRFEGGGAPVMKPIHLSPGGMCHAFYREPLLSQAVVIGEGGAMKNVFVRVVGGLPSREYTEILPPVVLNQEECLFKPHVLGIQVNQTLRFVNSDPLLHNVKAKPENSSAFNVSMPWGKKAWEHRFAKAEFPVEVKCDVHDHMKAYVGVIDHPFFSVTGEDGRYEISGLEAGTYEVEVWQELWAERLGVMTFSVTLDERESKNYDLVYTAGAQPVVATR